MSKLTFVHPSGERDVVEVSAGDSVMRAASDNLIRGIVGECGGDLSCATCHVFVDSEWFAQLPPASDDELAMLEATSEEPTEFSRLGCQVFCDESTDGMIVHIPASQQ